MSFTLLSQRLVAKLVIMAIVPLLTGLVGDTKG